MTLNERRAIAFGIFFSAQAAKQDLDATSSRAGMANLAVAATLLIRTQSKVPGFRMIDHDSVYEHAWAKLPAQMTSVELGHLEQGILNRMKNALVMTSVGKSLG